MTFRHLHKEFSIDDEWWKEAAMQDFKCSAEAYKSDCSTFRDRRVELVAIDDVEPLDRNLSHGVFNDTPEFGTAQSRVVRILTGIRAGAALPPVELVIIPGEGPHKYRLKHGAHRFYSSCAAGFTHIPAAIYRPSEFEY